MEDHDILQKPVLKSLVLPLQGYGLRDICKHPDLVNYQWQDDDASSQWSVVQFNQYLVETELNMKTWRLGWVSFKYQ